MLELVKMSKYNLAFENQMATVLFTQTCMHATSMMTPSSILSITPSSSFSILPNQTQENLRKPTMASKSNNLTPTFAYTVVYVKDVTKSLHFYEKAFGYQARREIQNWGELKSGETTIAFTPEHQHETDDITGSVQKPRSSNERAPVEVCFAYPDVDAAYKRAVENGAVPVSEPEDKPWGQKVGYVRDIDGIVVRIGSYVSEPSK